MATKREKQLTTLLLKERLERLTNKKVILKEFSTNLQVNIKGLEDNYKMLTPKLKEILPSNVKELIAFKKQVEKTYEFYTLLKTNTDFVKNKVDFKSYVLGDNGNYKHSVLEVLDNFGRLSLPLKTKLEDYLEEGNIDINSLYSSIYIRIERVLNKQREGLIKAGNNFSDKEKIIFYLGKNKIKNYTINDDLSVNVEGDVRIVVKGNLQIRFNKVSGSFSCNDNQLTTLQGAPKEVSGNFSCSNNQLTTLQGAPKEVSGNFSCSSNSKKFTKEEVSSQINVGGNIGV